MINGGGLNSPLLSPIFSSTSGSGSFTTNVFASNYGGGTPTDTPASGIGIAFDTSNGTWWAYYTGAWHQ